MKGVNTMININNISKSYTAGSEESEIIKDVSLHISKGEWCTIIGPSGTGKSTFLNCITGLLLPDKGEVFYEGTNVYNLKDKARSEYRRFNIGFVFQDFKLLPHYSVLDNVALPLLYDRPRHSLYARAKDLLEKVGIAEQLYDRLPEGLSGGEKQRVAISRALIANPEVLICDEPTGNLDSENRDIILDLLSELKRKGQTIIVVTHDDVVAKRGDVIYTLSHGILVKGGGVQ